MKNKYLVFSLVLFSLLLLSCNGNGPVYGSRSDTDYNDPDEHYEDSAYLFDYLGIYIRDTKPELFPVTVEVKISTEVDSEYKEVGKLLGSFLMDEKNIIKIQLSHAHEYTVRATAANGQKKTTAEHSNDSYVNIRFY